MSYLKPVKYHNFSFSTSTGRRALLKKTCQNGWCARLFEATHWQLLASFRYVHGVAEMHYSATTKAKRVFSFSTCHIGPNEWINNIVVPSFTIRCTQAVLHIDPEIKILLKKFCGPINPKGSRDREYFYSVIFEISDKQMQSFEVLFGVTIVLFSVFHNSLLRRFRVEFWGCP